MQKWEYKTLEFELDSNFWLGTSNFPQTEIESNLNNLGEEGWELMNSITNSESHGKATRLLLIFKRPKE